MAFLNAFFFLHKGILDPQVSEEKEGRIPIPSLYSKFT